MTLRVVLTRRASHDIREIVAWWAENRSAQQAEHWYAAALRAIRLLRHNPQRRPASIEAERLGAPTRQLAFGLGRKKTHRLVFMVGPDSVVILAVRHLAQDILLPGELN